MKKIISILAIIVVVCLVLAGLGQVALQKIKNPGDKEMLVRLENPEEGVLVEFVTAPGYLAPKEKVDLSSRIAARITELPYEEGERVTKGDPNGDPPVPASVLVRLDAQDLEAMLRSAEARYSAQEAQIEVQKTQIAVAQANLEQIAVSLEQTTKDLKRQKELFGSHDVSESSVDQLQSQLDQLKAQYTAGVHSLESSKLNQKIGRFNLEAADAEIFRARDALSYTVIRAPIDGIVTRINAEVGELVMTGTMNNAGTVIMQVADLSQMLIIAQVDESNIGSVKVGQQVEAKIQAYPDEIFQGVVDEIALTSSTGPNGKYYETEILLDTAGKQVYSGLTADVDIQTFRHEGVLRVPSQAIMSRPVDDLPISIRDENPNVDKDKTDATVVYCFQDDKAMVTPVKLGPSDATHTVITAGLTVEDRVVVGPYKVLENLAHDQEVKDELVVEKEKKDKEKGKEKLPKK